MIQKIVELGHIKTVILISLFSLVFSVLFLFAVGYFTGLEINPINYVNSILAPLIIAPIASWYIIKLLISTYHLEAKMRKMATYDTLTNVMSRRSFLTNAQAVYALVQRNNSSIAILYIDIDSFKKVNDTYGHSTGDEVLKNFGNILMEHKRESDLVGRLGGEEFTFLLPETNMKGAVKFADRLRDIVNNSVIIFDGATLSYSVSIGISVCNNDNEVTFDELVKQSDKALYVAKKSGKDCTILYNDI